MTYWYSFIEHKILELLATQESSQMVCLEFMSHRSFRLLQDSSGPYYPSVWLHVSAMTLHPPFLIASSQIIHSLIDTLSAGY